MEVAVQIVRGRPVLFNEIDAKFNIRGKSVVLAWGNMIFVPSGSLEVHPAIIAHERVHGLRQLARIVGDAHQLEEERIEAWWRRYITDIDFRREEETIAHIAELNHLCNHAGGRNERRRHLSIVASKLSNALYGPLMTKAQARKVLKDGCDACS